MTSQTSLSSFSFLVVLLALLLFGFPAKTCHGGREPTSTEFIRASCSSTTYPTLCFSSLSAYASTVHSSTRQLAHTALSVSLDSARSASAVIKKLSARGGMSPRAAAAMHDCMENVGDSVDELRQSMGAMEHLGGKDVGFQLNSIQTWVSAALTDDDTCLDGIARGGINSAVRGHVLKVAQLTSNALALVNTLVSSSQASP